MDPRAPFIGPGNENMDLLKFYLQKVIEEVNNYREGSFSSCQKSKQKINKTTFERQLKKAFQKLTERLLGNSQDPFVQQEVNGSNIACMLSRRERKDEGTIECWHNRYIAHMISDGIIPATIGSLFGNIMWQNNVVQSVSTVATILEHESVATLARIIGFIPYSRNRQINQHAGGRITSGGTIANNEALWILREKTVVSLGLLEVAKALGIKLPFKTKSTDENEKAEEIRKDFWKFYNYLREKTKEVGKEEEFEKLVQETRFMYMSNYERKKLPRIVYITSVEAHYSVEKACGILGVSTPPAHELTRIMKKQNTRERRRELLNLAEKYDFWFVDVDKHMQMDIKHLEQFLEYVVRKRKKEPIFIGAVIPTLGTTEVCSFDPLHKILEMRNKYENEGIFFYIHADAAYGGMYRIILDEMPQSAKKALEKLGEVETCTIDPHKLGYLPYPVGAVLTKDFRDRQLIYVGANYLYHGDQQFMSIGSSSMEGSKPASSPIAFWLTALTMTSEEVYSPMDAENPCNLYAPILKKTIKNTKYLYKQLKRLSFVKIFPNYHPEGSLICFQVDASPILKEKEAPKNISELEIANIATDLMVRHFNETPKKARKFVVSQTSGIAKANVTCMRVCLMNPYITKSLLREFVEEIRKHSESDGFSNEMSREIEKRGDYTH